MLNVFRAGFEDHSWYMLLYHVFGTQTDSKNTFLNKCDEVLSVPVSMPLMYPDTERCPVTHIGTMYMISWACVLLYHILNISHQILFAPLESRYTYIAEEFAQLLLHC